MTQHDQGKLGWFDRFATAASKFVSKAWFFAFCALLVVIWAPSIAIFHDINTWQSRLRRDFRQQRGANRLHAAPAR